MESAKHLILSLVLSIFVVIIGTIGYMVIERWDFIDAFFMTVITLTTVGYSETHPLSFAGRMFTIFLILVGFGFFIYVAGAVVEFMIEGRIRTILGRRRLDKQIERLKNHHIICGYGRIGRVLCRKLITRPLNLVVVDKDPETMRQCEDDCILHVPGDATAEATLLKAGINNAKCLVAVLGTDADNVFLVLTARQLNPKLEIIARAGGKGSEDKLRAAGANRVVSPYDMGAESMAQKILRPTVTSFLEIAVSDNSKEIQMEEIAVSATSDLVDVMLKDSGIRQKYNLIIIAIKEVDGKMLFNPSFETRIKIGETLIAVGEPNNLRKLEKILNP